MEKTERKPFGRDKIAGLAIVAVVFVAAAMFVTWAPVDRAQMFLNWSLAFTPIALTLITGLSFALKMRNGKKKVE